MDVLSRKCSEGESYQSRINEITLREKKEERRRGRVMRASCFTGLREIHGFGGKNENSLYLY